MKATLKCIIGVVLIVIGISVFGVSVLAGLAFLISAIWILPYSVENIQRKRMSRNKAPISASIRYTLVILWFLIGIILFAIAFAKIGIPKTPIEPKSQMKNAT